MGLVPPKPPRLRPTGYAHAIELGYTQGGVDLQRSCTYQDWWPGSRPLHPKEAVFEVPHEANECDVIRFTGIGKFEDEDDRYSFIIISFYGFYFRYPIPKRLARFLFNEIYPAKFIRKRIDQDD